MNMSQIKQYLKKESETIIVGNYKENIKMIACWRISGCNVAFYCPYCKKLHLHGWANENQNGTRQSHCTNPDSPKQKIIFGLRQTWLYKIFKKLKSLVTGENKIKFEGRKSKWIN